MPVAACFSKAGKLYASPVATLGEHPGVLGDNLRVTQWSLLICNSWYCFLILDCLRIGHSQFTVSYLMRLWFEWVKNNFQILQLPSST